MSDPGDAQPDKHLRKASDLTGLSPEQIEELGLPNLDQILKELQQQHGVRITLSAQTVDKLERLKATAPAEDVAILCPSSDVCILCDQDDNCSTCDVMDWCARVDTHVG